MQSSVSHTMHNSGYPHYDQIMKISNETTKPLSLIAHTGWNKYYVCLSVEKDDLEKSPYKGSITLIKRDDGIVLYLESLEYKNSITTNGRIFNFFIPGQATDQQKAIEIFVNGYNQLYSAANGKTIYMTLIEKLDGNGYGTRLKKLENHFSFAVDHGQVEKIAAKM